MPEHVPTSDSTVRMDTGRPTGRPPAAGQDRQVRPPVTAATPAGTEPRAVAARAVEADDTRPVPRDWMTDSADAPGAAEPGVGGAPVLTADPAEAQPNGSGGHDAAADGAGTQHRAPEGGSPAQTITDLDDTTPGDLWNGRGRDEATDSGEGADWHTEDLGAPGADGTAPVADAPTGGPAGPHERGPGAGAAGPQRPGWRRRAVLAPVAAVAVLGGAYGLDLLVAGGDIPRHTVVAGVDIGGLSPAAASSTLQKSLAPRLAAPRTVVAAEVRGTLSPQQAGLGLDVPATVAAAGHQPMNPWTRLTTLVADRPVRPVLSRSTADLNAALAAFAATVDRAPVEATITLEGTTPKLVPPADGRRVDRAGAATAITAAMVRGSSPSNAIRLPVVVAHPHVQTATARKVLDGIVTPALSAPVTVVSHDGSKKADVPVGAIATALTFTPKDDGELAVGIDPATLQAALGSTFGAFGNPAKDATFKVSGGSIGVVPSVDGSGVDPAKLATQLMTVLAKPAPRSVTAELGPVPARFTTDQAKALGVKEQVSSFTTSFTNSASGTNIRVVAEKVNGALVKPGETFSLNTFTGTRGSAQGYVPATVIENGKFVQAVGGGISQFATTMFNAEFFAGVQDIHHQTHSYYISRYPAGREATVFDGLIDLVWKNDSATGIYVQTAWTPGSLTVTFWGTKHYTIESISSARTNVVTPPVQDQPNDGTCTPQGGADGFNITVTRVFKDLTSGAVLRTEDFRTHYVAEPIIHCLAVTPPASPSPTG